MEENSLLQLYLLSYKFPQSKFNCKSTCIIFILSALYLYTTWDKKNSFEIFSSTLDFGASIVPSILGFLIAGFTVFVTITKPGVFSLMAKKEFENTGQSYLKHNLSAFILAFVHYLSYLSMVFIIKVFVIKNPIFSTALSLLKNECIDLKKFIIIIFTATLISWTWYLIMLLKSFIYNVHQIVVTSVRWELDNESTSDNQSK